MSALIKFLLTLAWGCEVVAGKLRRLGNRLDTLGMPDPGFHPPHCFNCGEDSDECDEYGMCPICAHWLSPIPASKSPAIQELKTVWGMTPKAEERTEYCPACEEHIPFGSHEECVENW